MERMVMDLMRIGWAAFFVSANLCVQTISCASLTIPDPSSNVKCHLQLSLASDVCSQLLAREAQPLDRSSRAIGDFF